MTLDGCLQYLQTYSAVI